MRYVILGAGGVGCAIGGRLQLAGIGVTFIARGEHLRAMQSGGLRLRTPAEDRKLEVHAVGTPYEAEITTDDVVVLAVKSQDTVAALRDLVDAAGPDVAVVCAQNGVTNEAEAAILVRRVYGALVYVPATFLLPGEVSIHADPIPGLLDTGLYPSGRDRLAESVCGDFERAGFIAQVQERIMSLKYRKLLHNIANVTQALCGPDVDATELVEALRREGAACLEAAGIELASLEEYEGRVSRVVFTPIDGETRGGSSIWQSLERRTGSTEVDFLNGEIARLGEAHGHPAPLNRIVQRLMHEATARGLPPGGYTPEEVLALASGDLRT